MERMTSSAHGFPYNSIPQRGSQTEAFPGSVVVTDEIDHLKVQLGLSLGGGGTLERDFQFYGYILNNLS